MLKSYYRIRRFTISTAAVHAAAAGDHGRFETRGNFNIVACLPMFALRAREQSTPAVTEHMYPPIRVRGCVTMGEDVAQPLT